jgi:hypothetical protein
MMTLTKMISAIVAVCSVWLGGSLGAVVLEKAKAAPVAGQCIRDQPLVGVSRTERTSVPSHSLTRVASPGGQVERGEERHPPDRGRGDSDPGLLRRGGNHRRPRHRPVELVVTPKERRPVC